MEDESLADYFKKWGFDLSVTPALPDGTVAAFVNRKPSDFLPNVTPSLNTLADEAEQASRRFQVLSEMRAGLSVMRPQGVTSLGLGNLAVPSPNDRQMEIARHELENSLSELRQQDPDA